MKTTPAPASVLWPLAAVLVLSLLAVGWFLHFGPGSVAPDGNSAARPAEIR